MRIISGKLLFVQYVTTVTWYYWMIIMTTSASFLPITHGWNILYQVKTQNNNPLLEKILKTVSESIQQQQSSPLASETKRKNEELSEKEALRRQGNILLERLNLTSSTTPKPFTVTDPKYLPNILSAAIPALFRVGTGAFSEGYEINIVNANPSKYTIFTFNDQQLEEKSNIIRKNYNYNFNQQTMSNKKYMAPIMIYDQEGSPSCRLVREACSILSLTVNFRPCPKNGVQYMSQLPIGTKIDDLPMVYDPNTSIEWTASLERGIQPILLYLFKTYGNGYVPWVLSNPSFTKVTSTLAMASRFGLGSTYRSANKPLKPLTVWGYETSPFCKIVTETLCAHELEYVMIYTPRGSPNRQRMVDEYGRFQVPLLIDPNTGVELWESSAICEYLQKQYAVRTTVSYL